MLQGEVQTIFAKLIKTIGTNEFEVTKKHSLSFNYFLARTT